MQKKYVQTTFDIAFNRIVLYLKKEGIIKQITFAKEIGLTSNNLGDILRADRGLPEHKRTFATYLLTSKYNVNPTFLKTNKGQFLNKPLDLKPEEYPQVAAVQQENETLKTRITELESRINYLKKIVETQELLISTLKNKN